MLPSPWRAIIQVAVLATTLGSIGRAVQQYLFRLKPAYRNAERSEQEYARVHRQNAELCRLRETSSDDYRRAFEEGQALLTRMWSRATLTSDRSRVLKHYWDFNQAMSSDAAEPDIAKRMSGQAESMRDAIRMMTMVSGSLAKS